MHCTCIFQMCIFVIFWQALFNAKMPIELTNNIKELQWIWNYAVYFSKLPIVSLFQFRRESLNCVLKYNWNRSIAKEDRKLFHRKTVTFMNHHTAPKFNNADCFLLQLRGLGLCIVVRVPITFCKPQTTHPF